jgi:uncharacterized protein (TIGR03437 family)
MRQYYRATKILCVVAAGLFAPVLCPAQGSLPSIAPGGIVSASSFGQLKSIAPGSWIEIYGSSLAIDSRQWAGSDFNGVNAPTSLDGTKVTVGGQPAFIDYISAGQVNAQVPSNVAAGFQQVIVTTASGPSAPYSITVNATEPGLLAPASFNIGGQQYAAALYSDGATFVLPPGSIAGVTSRRAQPGDTITLYGIGFGPVVPGIPAGQVVQQSNTLAASLQVKFGTTLATTTYDGLAPSAVGLYQVNVVVPAIPSSDSVPLTFTLGGVAGTQTLYLAIQNGNTTPQVQALTLSASSVASGGTVQGTVTLSAAAPVGGAAVALSSNSSVATIPSTIIVPAGGTTATFTIAAGTVSSTQSATILASYQGSSAQATLNITVASGTLPQWNLLSATITCPGGASGTAGIGINDEMFPDGTVGTATFLGCNFGVGHSPVSIFNAEFRNVTIDGNTFSSSTIVTGAAYSEMLGPLGASYPIVSGSATLTLNPQSSTSGTISGNYTLTSSLTTLSGSISGSYTIVQ